MKCDQIQTDSNNFEELDLYVDIGIRNPYKQYTGRDINNFKEGVTGFGKGKGGNGKGGNGKGSNGKGGNCKGGNCKGGNCKGSNCKGGNCKGCNGKGYGKGNCCYPLFSNCSVPLFPYKLFQNGCYKIWD